MKKLLFAAVAASVLMACSEQASKTAYLINGTATGLDGQVVVLRTDRDTLGVDTICNGQFDFAGEVADPCQVIAVVDRRHANYFILEPGTINISLDGSCPATGTPLNDELQAFSDFSQSINQQYQAGADPDSLGQVYTARIDEICKNHVGDPLGLMMTQEIAQDLSAAELDSIMSLCELYKNDPKLQAIAENLSIKEATGPGKEYINVEGVDAVTGKPLSLADVLAKGYPVVVDFWASWCGPCRREIQESLSKYAPQYKGKINFVGIAVWEQKVEDTQKAMKELPISWPVIYANEGGKPQTEAYGIQGIPHIMFIAPDGTILARDLRGEKIAEAIEEYLSQFNTL